jgi:hypothetical protein
MQEERDLKDKAAAPHHDDAVAGSLVEITDWGKPRDP